MSSMVEQWGPGWILCGHSQPGTPPPPPLAACCWARCARQSAVLARGGCRPGPSGARVRGRRAAVLCCAVLGCAVLCCAVLCCVVLCCVVLCCAGLGWVTSSELLQHVH
jgi:hypothetical protein